MKQRPLPKKSCVKSDDWKELYLAALYESDKIKLAKRIAQAQIAIETERKKLFISMRDIRDITHERQVLDNASFCLQALASCMAIPPVASSPRAMQVRIA
jgi:hypothetical protein